MNDYTIWLVLAALLVGYVLGRATGRRVPRPSPRAVPPGQLSDRAKLGLDEALRRGERIDAIRVVREDTGCGLKEAKAFVDAYAAKKSERRPGDPIE